MGDEHPPAEPMQWHAGLASKGKGKWNFDFLNSESRQQASISFSAACIQTI
jgi:hypothetical protein